MPTLSLLEPRYRAGPSFYQEAHLCEPWIPFGGGRAIDDCWLRGDARDTKGTSPMACQGECCRSGPIHPTDPRHSCLITGLSDFTPNSPRRLRQILPPVLSVEDPVRMLRSSPVGGFTVVRRVVPAAAPTALPRREDNTASRAREQRLCDKMNNRKGHEQM